MKRSSATGPARKLYTTQVLLILGTITLCFWQGPWLVAKAFSNVEVVRVMRALGDNTTLQPDRFFLCNDGKVEFNSSATTLPLVGKHLEYERLSARAAILLAYMHGDYLSVKLAIESRSPHPTNDPLFFYITGLTMAKQGQWQEALVAWRRAGLETALHRMGKSRAFGSSKDIRCAIAFYRLAADVNPEYVPSYVSLGYVLWNTGEVSTAARVFLQASHKSLSDFERYLYLGHAYHLMGHYQEAVDAYTKASEYPQADREMVIRYLGQAKLGLGRQLYRDGDYQAALDMIQIGLQLAPADAYGQLYLADVYLALGDCQKAVDAYGKALELGIGDDFIRSVVKNNVAKCVMGR